MRYGVALTFVGIATLTLAVATTAPRLSTKAQTASAEIGYDEEGNPEVIEVPDELPPEYVPDGEDPCAGYSDCELNYPDYYVYPNYDVTYSYPTYSTTPAPTPYYKTVLPGFNSVITPIAQPLLPKTQAASTPVAAPSCAIAANPASIAYNGSTVLKWSSYGATSASLTGLGAVDTTGSWQFDNQRASRNFTLAVMGQGGVGSCQTYLSVQQQVASTPTPTLAPAAVPQTQNGVQLYTVPPQQYYYTQYGYDQSTQPPVCNVIVDPSAVAPGQSATITWSSPYALRGTITDVGTVAPSGSITVTPSVSHPIVFSAINNYGTNTCSTYVTVAAPPSLTQTEVPAPPPPPPPASLIQTENAPEIRAKSFAPSCTLSADPATIVQGGAATLSWKSKNATELSIEGIAAVATSGSTYVTPAQTSVFTLDISGEGGSRSCTTTVTVLPCPSSCPNSVATPAQKSSGFWAWLAGLF